MLCYNSAIVYMPASSYQSLCRMGSRWDTCLWNNCLQGASRLLNIHPAKKELIFVAFNNVKYLTLGQSCNLTINLKLCLHLHTDKTYGASYCCVAFHSSYVTLLFVKEKKMQFWGKLFEATQADFHFLDLNSFQPFFNMISLKTMWGIPPISSVVSQILVSCFWGWFIQNACMVFWVLVVCLGFCVWWFSFFLFFLW